MIEVEPVDKIAVLRMQHGRANALDLEFCQTLAARFDVTEEEMAGVEERMTFKLPVALQAA